MEEILVQRLNFGSIRKYKLYDLICEEYRSARLCAYDNLSDDECPLSMGKKNKTFYINVPENYLYPNVKKGKKERTKGYSFHKGLITLTRYRTFLTTKDRHIKRCYGDFSTGISLYTYWRRITLFDNKLKVSLFTNKRLRHVSTNYFKTREEKVEISFDFNNGNILIRKAKKIFR